MSQPTYSAFFQDDHEAVVYQFKVNDGTLNRLPQDAKPASDDERNTLNRTDGGDPYEFALFRTSRGQLIVVQRDR